MAKDKDFLFRIGNIFADKLEKSNLTEFSKIVLREGLYIGLMFNLWKVTARVPVLSFWGAQREVMRQTLSGLAGALRTEIPLIKWRPMEWAYRLVRTWEDALKDTPDNTELVDSVRWYKRVEPSLRVLMVLMFPGLLRLFVNLTRQLVQVVR